MKSSWQEVMRLKTGLCYDKKHMVYCFNNYVVYVYNTSRSAFCYYKPEAKPSVYKSDINRTTRFVYRLLRK